VNKLSAEWGMNLSVSVPTCLACVIFEITERFSSEFCIKRIDQIRGELDFGFYSKIQSLLCVQITQNFLILTAITYFCLF
jgi:hypothetical protein